MPVPAKVLCVVGARPNFMKIAPVIKSLRENPLLAPPLLVHTGQHYDADMKHCFFEQLGIPEPDIDLEVGSGSHAEQTAEIMKRFEPVLDRSQPRAVLVVGDVNSTIACGLVAVKKGIPLVHVEAGLRSRDRTMPEEINRILTDRISELLFTTEPEARMNLLEEGIPDAGIHYVGNVMIDTLVANLDRARQAFAAYAARSPFGFAIEKGGFGILTMHRPSNVDDPAILAVLLDTIRRLSEELPILFPMHPRTRSRIDDSGLQAVLEAPGLVTVPPLGYHEMLGLMANARMVLTDSGGIQEETTALGVPCLTLRENTERPVTVNEGTNTIVGRDPDRIAAAFRDIQQTGGKAGRVPDLWDGNAAQRISNVLGDWFQ